MKRLTAIEAAGIVKNYKETVDKEIEALKVATLEKIYDCIHHAASQGYRSTKLCIGNYYNLPYMEQKEAFISAIEEQLKNDGYTIDYYRDGPVEPPRTIKW